MNLIQHKEYNQVAKLLGPSIYGYLGAMFIIAIVGMIVQCGIKSNVEEKKEATNEPKPEEQPK